jgi:hypothetical protein
MAVIATGSHGEPLNPDERLTFTKYTGRTLPAPQAGVSLPHGGEEPRLRFHGVPDAVNDHPRHGHDDIANAVAGALVFA